MIAAPDATATLKLPAGTPITERVKAQLQRDYPPGALGWVDSLSWQGPVSVPVTQIDRSAGDWSAADDKRKVAAFAKRIGAGWKKPVVAIRRPGQRLLYLVDGHTRATACAQIGQPVTAWIGTAKTADGDWMKTHHRQLASDLAALELSAAGYPAGTIKPRSGMISLDLPQGTIKPVPGGVKDHHITVVYLGEDVGDAAFAKACARAQAAASSAGGPLTGTAGGVGTFPPSADGDGQRPAFAKVTLPGASPLRSALEDLSASEHKDWKPHITLAYIGKDDPLPAPVPPTPVKFTHLSVHRGKDVARFPLGGSQQLASDGGAVELTAETPAASTVPHPFGSPSGPGLWRVKGMQLDPYVQNVARALLRKGRARDRSQAIRMAYGLIQDWAAGRTPNGKGHVHPDVQAAAARSLASMNAKRAAAHAHASDAPAVDLAGMWNEQAHPRVAKGHAGGGRFGSGGAPIAAPPQGGRGPRLAPPPPGPAPEPPAELTRIRHLRHQASQDRHLARQIMLKIQALIRIRDAYIAGLVTPTGLPRKPVNPARSAAAKKAATTRKRNPAPRKKGVRSSTPGGAKAANVAKMNGQISTLRNDARALIKSANSLNAQANGL